MAENLRERDLKVDALRSSIKGHGIDLENARGLLAWVIEHNAWRERVDMLTGHRIEFRSFEDFVIDEPPRGLGSTTADLERLVAGTPVELALREVRKPGKGRPKGQKPSNITNKSATKHGTTRAYALDRLKRDRPDLLARVLAGELSANAAAIEAGFRKPKATIPVDTPEAAIAALLRRFSHDELRAALKAERS